MRIGRVLVAHPFTLAPLEEHSNYPFRLLMKEFGASLMVSERTDAADVARRDRRAMRRLYTAPAEAPRSGQLSGGDADTLAAAARVVEELGFDLVDLNFECPVRRFWPGAKAGPAWPIRRPSPGWSPPWSARVSIPVTLKIRSGPDAEHLTAVEAAVRREQAGAAAVSLHAPKRRPRLCRRPGLAIGRAVSSRRCKFP